ncbi:phosphodiester glycosidase family protein [Paenibacillus sp. HB172176]|uniref:phosphodiester glycosidase family protein n=1 Tax=Paenibacillus sp. HB172176 TaxID=2493690 RepID=UPI0014394A9A|nr:phosphodiester glycosidase family protein [Paenibacillus sp. HB172176]
MQSLSRKKKIFLAAFIVLALIGAVLYKLADRYLIEHVEVVVASPSLDKSDDSISDSTVNEADGGSAGADNQSEDAGSDSQAVADDWNYKSEDATISIQKEQTGSGEDTITYFVADVTVKDASSLLTAFAKNAFGTNITQDTSTIAENNNAIFAINGDYYGFRDDGVVVRNGTVYRDEPAREGFAAFEDGTMRSYDENTESTSDLIAAGVTNTFSFGPALVQDGEAITYTGKVTIDTNFGNRSIQAANPRTGIGMIAPNHYVFVVVDGRDTGYSRGMTLTEFSQLFVDLGATEAYNLDGGGSSTMYFNGRVVNNPQGKGQERGVSDIIYIPE